MGLLMKSVIYSIFASITASTAAADIPPPPPEMPVEMEQERSCDAVTITLYFSEQASDLSSYARKSLESALDTLEGCAITEIRATSVSGNISNQDLLTELSEQRAENTLEAISATGIWSNSVQRDIVLSRQNNRHDNTVAPLSHRIELEIDAELQVSA